MKVFAAATGSALLLAGCATQPVQTASGPVSAFDSQLGVSASPRVVADGESVPKGGGSFLVGRPYTIGGRQYVPSDHPAGYSAVGTASWYGDAFHGRRTANGEVFDKGSISAAHPTLPLPSYVRVTNLGNGRSMIVRVNDRGPYHGNRVMDVSQRVAEALDFRIAGTARIRVDYIARASLAGSDDEKLVATLRTDGQLARLDGVPDASDTRVAGNNEPGLPSRVPASPQPARVAWLSGRQEPSPEQADAPMFQPAGRFLKVPVPPPRPYDVSAASAPDRTLPQPFVPERKPRPRVATYTPRANQTRE